jgi:2-dehydro-3-deoxyphosphogluconate aldolase/(4S)-4-hydroxy-2-oxoglutarate aldolase
MLKGLAGPLAELKLCPTGGISEANAAEFLAQPNVVCVGGSWMVPKQWLVAGEWDKVREASAKAAAIVQHARDA